MKKGALPGAIYIVTSKDPGHTTTSSIFGGTIVRLLHTWTPAIERQQNAQIQIVLSMHSLIKVLLSCDLYNYIQWFYMWTAKALIRLHKCI